MNSSISKLKNKSDISKPKRKTKTIKFNNFEYKEQQNTELSRFQDIKLKKNILNNSHSELKPQKKMKGQDEDEDINLRPVLKGTVYEILE